MLLLAGFTLLVLQLLRGGGSITHMGWQFDGVALLLGSAGYALSLMLAAAAWITIMHGLGASSTWRQHMQCFMYSRLAHALPTPAPLFASRVLLYERIGVSGWLTGAGLFWEQRLCLASSILLFLLLLPLTPVLQRQAQVLPVLLAVIMVFLLRPTLIIRLLQRLGKHHPDSSDTLKLPTRRLIIALAVYILVWFSGGMVLFLVARGMVPLDWQQLPLVVQSWVLSGLVSYLALVLPASFGIRHLTLVALLALAMPVSAAVVIVVLIRVWYTANELIWAGIVSRL
jgi:hypothetical protein